MKKPAKEVILLTKLASFIAKDDLKNIESAIKSLKSANVKDLKIYETIMQCYLFCGFPIVIESLKLFKTIFEDFKIKSSEYNAKEFHKNGKFTCKLVYKNNYKKLIGNMNSLSPELKDWMIIEGYGKVMSRKGLSIQEREYINVAVLFVKFYKHQLHSHLKGCLNVGAEISSIKHILSENKNTAGVKNYTKTLKLLNSFDHKHVI